MNGVHVGHGAAFNSCQKNISSHNFLKTVIFSGLNGSSGHSLPGRRPSAADRRLMDHKVLNLAYTSPLSNITIRCFMKN